MVEMSEWQPIETAPKDGAAVLVWDGQHIMTARYGGSWWKLVYAGEWASDDRVWPTHWMPLPEPPR